MEKKGAIVGGVLGLTVLVVYNTVWLPFYSTYAVVNKERERVETGKGSMWKNMDSEIKKQSKSK